MQFSRCGLRHAGRIFFFLLTVYQILFGSDTKKCDNLGRRSRGQCCNFFVVLLNPGTLHIYPYNSTPVIKKPPKSGGRGLKL